MLLSNGLRISFSPSENSDVETTLRVTVKLLVVIPVGNWSLCSFNGSPVLSSAPC